MRIRESSCLPPPGRPAPTWGAASFVVALVALLGACPGPPKGGVPPAAMSTPKPPSSGHPPERTASCTLLPALGEGRPRCVPPANPCSPIPPPPRCRRDEECAGLTLCWWNRCVTREQWESGRGFECLSAHLELEYGGAAPDHIYTYELVLPAPRRADASTVTLERDTYLWNHLRPYCLRPGLCISREKPVEVRQEGQRLLASGGSGFVLFEARDKPSASGWVAPDPLRLSWKVQPPGDRRGARKRRRRRRRRRRRKRKRKSPRARPSRLHLALWSSARDGCRTEVRYDAALPIRTLEMSARPTVRRICRWPVLVPRKAAAPPPARKTSVAGKRRGASKRKRRRRRPRRKRRRRRRRRRKKKKPAAKRASPQDRKEKGFW